MSTIPQQLADLRAAMQQLELTAYLIPSSDPHQSEYVAPHWQVRPWLSGFTGSAGTLVVTMDTAGLWTDSRYFLQAEQELAGSGIQLMKQGVAHAPEHLDWLAAQLPTGSKLGFDGKVISRSQAKAMQQKFSAKDISLVAQHDLPSQIWANRPELPQSEVFAFSEQFSGEGRASKISRIRHWLKEQAAQAVLFVALDEIAWALNIRASDVDYNPVCISYLWVGTDEIKWFVGTDRITTALTKELAIDGVTIEAYDTLNAHLANYPASVRLAVDPATISYFHYEQIKDKQPKSVGSPVVALKTIKNKTEIEHLRQTMAKDGVALLRLFRWLETELKTRGVSEVEVSDHLTRLRAKQANYHGDSFPAIVGYQGNGAIVHYHANEESCATIQAEGILLLDSGGQYLDGTTDITRTVALGPSTIEQRRHFTLVLKGMIALSRAKFPKGTGGAQLDTLARQFLWQDGLNFGHGTGHGVGFFLNVHEGPQGFATSAVTSRGRTAFEPGMVTSNEPGFYRIDHYGIRIENLIVCVNDQQTNYGDFLRFETLTLFPIDRQLIQLALLSEEETDWLNTYHQQVMDGMLPLLTDEAEREWLRFQCRPL